MENKSSNGWKFFALLFGGLLAALVGLYIYKQQNPDYDPWEEPWENSSTYEGQLRLESDGVVYRFERSFQKNKKGFIVINETAGREVEPTKAFMDELLCGLSETATTTPSASAS